MKKQKPVDGSLNTISHVENNTKWGKPYVVYNCIGGCGETSQTTTLTKLSSGNKVCWKCRRKLSAASQDKQYGRYVYKDEEL